MSTMLPPPDDFVRHRAEEIVSRHYTADPSAEGRYGPRGREKCIEDTAYTLLYLQAAALAQDYRLFREYVAWVKAVFLTYGVALEDLAGMLRAAAEVLSEREEWADGVGYLRRAVAELDRMPVEPASHLPGGAEELGAGARDFLDALLARDHRRAASMVLSKVHSADDVKDVCLNLFQPCLREVGRLWQTNRLTSAQEHYFTAATQLIMAQLYPYVLGNEPADSGRRVVATCADGELHEVGMRMVADFLEMEGVPTVFLGASTPAAAVVRMVESEAAPVLAISATIAANLPRVKALATLLRSRDSCAGVKILVGGYAFNQASGMWRSMGADGWAPDAEAAVRIVKEWLDA